MLAGGGRVGDLFNGRVQGLNWEMGWVKRDAKPQLGVRTVLRPSIPTQPG